MGCKYNHMKILDSNIDQSTIKCWCVFSDQSFDLSQKQDVNEGRTGDIASKIWNMTKSGVSKTLNYTASKISRATKHAMVGRKHNSLAFMTFSCKNDENSSTKKYVFTFNFKKCRWYLLNAGLGVGNSDNAMPSYEETSTFLSTDTCQKFISSCAKYILPWLDDENMLNMLINTFQNAGGNAIDMIKIVKRDKDKISQNMFDMSAISNSLLTMN